MSQLDVLRSSCETLLKYSKSQLLLNLNSSTTDHIKRSICHHSSDQSPSYLDYPVLGSPWQTSTCQYTALNECSVAPWHGHTPKIEPLDATRDCFDLQRIRDRSKISAGVVEIFQPSLPSLFCQNTLGFGRCVARTSKYCICRFIMI